MAERFEVVIDPKGWAQIAKSAATGRMVDKAAERIAAVVRAQVGPDVPVTVTSYTTDREAAAVTIAHISGVGLQAKRGLLTRAAAGIRADVRIRR